ncbi:MAG: protein phosphatase 2C domain-containing protein [Polyangiaceae bacterium]|nr:protein phosphatase 2C domain-containing protein [Polyangiaceae bacterium]
MLCENKPRQSDIIVSARERESTIEFSAYDLSDEGPGRTVNEDATLSRPDLGLFAIADGAGGKGRGDVAAALALRALENYVGATARSTHEKGQFDRLGNTWQARRLSAAIHQAHQYIIDAAAQQPERKGMGATIAALLFTPLTEEVIIASVGDTRIYRLRHGHLEQLTQDHTIATEVLERRPTLDDAVMEKLPRNSVIRALGLGNDLRVSVQSWDVAPGDRFLIASDGLTQFVPQSTLSEVMTARDSLSNLATELLGFALAARSTDNISMITLEAQEIVLDDELPTARYHEIPHAPPSTLDIEPSEAPNSAEFSGPEIASEEFVAQVTGASTESRFNPNSILPPPISTPTTAHELHRPASTPVIEPGPPAVRSRDEHSSVTIEEHESKNFQSGVAPAPYSGSPHSTLAGTWHVDEDDIEWEDAGS